LPQPRLDPAGSLVELTVVGLGRNFLEAPERFLRHLG
jgi:hypothetical protein